MSEYAKHADGQDILPLDGYTVLPVNTTLQKGDCPFDVYSGWFDASHFNPDYHSYAIDQGRWTAWARKSSEKANDSP